MLIYLRHGDDRGDDVYRHDRRLNDRGKKKAAREAKRLIEKYGHPDVVFVSPFRRALETVDCMRTLFVRPVAIQRDPRIAQHLSDKQMRDPRVSPATMEFIDLDENLGTFRQRIAAHVEHVRIRAKDTAVIWGVTHQVVIEEIAVHFGVEISEKLDFLDHVVMLG